jgi:hypothetical protein
MSELLYHLGGASLQKFRDEVEGEVVEYLDPKTGVWEVLDLTNLRIIPEIKKDIVKRMFVEANPTLDNAFNEPNLELTFDGETNVLKLVRILYHLQVPSSLPGTEKQEIKEYDSIRNSKMA